jgi:hypothetical protein
MEQWREAVRELTAPKERSGCRLCGFVFEPAAQTAQIPKRHSSRPTMSVLQPRQEIIVRPLPDRDGPRVAQDVTERDPEPISERYSNISPQ